MRSSHLLRAIVPIGLASAWSRAELVLALAITSALRLRLSYKTWRMLYRIAYACWPIAVLHGAGTGSDVRAGWFTALTAFCVALVFATLVGWRLGHGWPRAAAFRVGVAIGSGLAIVTLTLWMANGPLASGWARAAGTPTDLTRSAPTPSATPASKPSSTSLGRSRATPGTSLPAPRLVQPA